MTHILIDGNNLAYRIRYGIGNAPHLHNQIVSAFIGQLTFFLFPDVQTVTVCFDAGIPASRLELLPEYKEHRSHSEDQRVVYRAIDSLVNILPKIRVNVLKVQDFEADDLIHATANLLVGDVLIVSADRDLYQCLTKDDRVVIYNPARKKKIYWQSIVASFGITPDRWTDFRALTGDSSDNIPGIKGIGEVYGQQILSQFDNVYDLVRYLNHNITRDDWEEDTGLAGRFYDMLIDTRDSLLVYEKVSNLSETESAASRYLFQHGAVFRFSDADEIEALAVEIGCYDLLMEYYRFAALDSIKGYLA
jgi:5'-3' exonuclease